MSLSLVVYEFICSTGVAEQKVLFDNGYFLNDAAAPAKKASAQKNELVHISCILIGKHCKKCWKIWDV